MNTKFLILLIFSATILGCSSSKKVALAKVNDTEDLVGLVTKENFSATPYSTWFEPNYTSYKFNKAVVEKLKPALHKITIKAFMGTWCGDSQLQVPFVYKVLDAAEFNYKNLELTAVNTDKSTPDNAQEGFAIERVPTFIFYKDGKEIGRLVEYPVETIEKDFLKIVIGEPYKHSYEE